MSKTLFYEVEDNGDLSNTVRSIDDCCEIIKGWIDDNRNSINEDPDVYFTITPVWMTEKEYEELEEA